MHIYLDNRVALEEAPEVDLVAVVASEKVSNRIFTIISDNEPNIMGV